MNKDKLRKYISYNVNFSVLIIFIWFIMNGNFSLRSILPSLLCTAIIFTGYLIPLVLYETLIYFIFRKKTLNKYFNHILFLFPIYFLLIVYMFIEINPHVLQKHNQRDPLKSPSKKFILKVPVEDDFWTVTIYNKEKKLLYKDDSILNDAHSKFAGWFNSYWCWDKDDRVWLYNSDNGAVYFWELVDNKWKKEEWDRENYKYYPPIELFPDYAKKYYFLDDGKRKL